LLIGDTMGRAGVTWQAWSTYWLSPRDKVQVSYRNQYVSPQFLAGGGTQNDIRGSSNFVLKHNWEVELGVQSERVVMPLLYGSTFAEVQRERMGGRDVLAGSQGGAVGGDSLPLKNSCSGRSDPGVELRLELRFPR
jgi:hypothetical protein